jgi:ABC-type multidrug transport system permease subunit
MCHFRSGCVSPILNGELFLSFVTRMEIASLGASNSTNTSNSRTLIMKWWILVIIIVSFLTFTYLFYRCCCARSKNKRKLHTLIGEERAVELLS